MSFWSGDRVKIIKTPGPLDGREGVVVGIGTVGMIPTYIIGLDESFIDNLNFRHAAVVIPEVCLLRLSDDKLDPTVPG